jgi:hypothetical protein
MPRRHRAPKSRTFQRAVNRHQGIGRRGSGNAFPFALRLGQDQTEQLLVEHLSGRGCEVSWRTMLTGLSVTPDDGCVIDSVYCRLVSFFCRSLGSTTGAMAER